MGKMFVSILKKIFGTKSQRDLRRMRPLIARINRLEEEYQKLSDDELTLPVSDYPSGVYYINLMDKKKNVIYTEKFVKK